MWYCLNMAHNRAREAPASYTVELAPRGRLVVPAGARKRVGLTEGDTLVLTVEDDGSLRVRRLEDQVKRMQGAYARRAKGRSLAGELIEERRSEAGRERRG
jgi:AbrB family looped-hinge helix DNA binding protein